MEGKLELVKTSKKKIKEDKYPAGRDQQFSLNCKVVCLSQREQLKTIDVGDIWSKVNGLVGALLCSLVYRLRYEAI